MAKKFVLFKNNTSWLSSLLVSSVFSVVMFILALAILILNTLYSNNPDKIYDGGASAKFKFEVIVFPMQFVLSIAEIVIAIYLCFNIPLWWMALKNSMGERKKFNSLFVYVSTPLTILIMLDALFRFFYVIVYFSAYLSSNDATNDISIIDFNKFGILGSFSTYSDRQYGNFGFNTLLLLIFSLLMLVLSLSYHLLQRKKYKSEQAENSKADVQNYYRNLEKEKIRKEMKKHKQKDLSKKIKTF